LPCYELTYTSCQESHIYDAMYAAMAGDLGMDVETVKWGFKMIVERYKQRGNR
jgi:hypothetical protein